MSEQGAGGKQTLTLTSLGIDTYKEAVIYLRADCEVCKSEGFEAFTRVRVQLGERSIIATIHTVKSNLLRHCQASLSEYAWKMLGAKEGDEVQLSHPRPLTSLEDIRRKIYGGKLGSDQLNGIIGDITSGRLSEIHIAAFLTACANGRLDIDEIDGLTASMVKHGNRLHWRSGSDVIVDKHCVGGLPGNRTTPIIVAIVSAFGLTMPKTSSRSITSPAGTADTMEVLAPVELDLADIRKVVEAENGCIVWGGAVDLSPADDVLIRVERALVLDSTGQMVASVLSKKIAAGSTHVVIDIPVGPAAKIRSTQAAEKLKHAMEEVGRRQGLHVKVLLSDGRQPVGFGIGPALEARDVLQVLQNDPAAPVDLREHALTLAAAVLEFSTHVPEGEGKNIARDLLQSGKAWKKFQAICRAQGGMRPIPNSSHQHLVRSTESGVVSEIHTYHIAQLAKLAGAPKAKAAGVDLHVKLGQQVEVGAALYTVHAESQGELQYALHFIRDIANQPVKIRHD